VTALCVNEKLSKIDKFFYILAQGEKIQKWSIFENLTLYIDNAHSAEKIFHLIEVAIASIRKTTESTKNSSTFWAKEFSTL
jgi:vacuolar-type H+-ATPase catalytic subunit A/Vma1